MWCSPELSKIFNASLPKGPWDQERFSDLEGPWCTGTFRKITYSAMLHTRFSCILEYGPLRPAPVRSWGGNYNLLITGSRLMTSPVLNQFLSGPGAETDSQLMGGPRSRTTPVLTKLCTPGFQIGNAGLPCTGK